MGSRSAWRGRDDSSGKRWERDCRRPEVNMSRMCHEPPDVLTRKLSRHHSTRMYHGGNISGGACSGAGGARAQRTECKRPPGRDGDRRVHPFSAIFCMCRRFVRLYFRLCLRSRAPTSIYDTTRVYGAPASRRAHATRRGVACVGARPLAHTHTPRRTNEIGSMTRTAHRTARHSRSLSALVCSLCCVLRRAHHR